MDKIFKGIVEFKQNDFDGHKNLFSDLKGKQEPHTLFIGCSDSRVVPNLITNTLPGELFMVRNIGNLVPPSRETNDYVATTAAIEYAVKVLKVKSIVVCGHSNCAACNTLYQDEKVLSELPHVKKWLELINPIKEYVEKVLPNGKREAKEWLTEQMNIVEQIKHLLTYPFVRERYESGQLNIYGWYYIIETGEVYNYNKDQGYFELIQ